MSEPIYLTDEELILLTGFKQKSHQIKWLTANRIHHYVNKLGRPIVIRSEFTGNYRQQVSTKVESPDFGALLNG
ncbi:DUF4224 domain-containing protein [Xenorhabdus sp. 18]|uniref:DUF4224 domain-containing protein n=1 Tax=Xenorhabdus doucetiae TaxID=351671 RepID=UPI001992B93B|nr:DUF4224 domain-containing protein [Xenorhabdus sp. 18]MBD2795413.1 DUF4224 domain-containing protein [Xenorhabdus sp. 18]